MIKLNATTISHSKAHIAKPANRHSSNQNLNIQQSAVQRAQNENAGTSEHESDVQTAVQLKSSCEPSADFIRPNALVQAKLNIGKPNDKYEVEADRIADKVVSGAGKAEKATTSPIPKIQKKDAKGPVEGDGVKEEDVVETDIQQKAEKSSASDDESTVQEKPLSESITPVVQLKELPPLQRVSEEESDVQAKCDKCEEEEKVQKMDSEGESGTEVQMKLDASTEDVQKMEDEGESDSEVQMKLDSSTEEVQQMNDTQEEKIQTKCSACGKEESAAKLNVQQKCAKCEAEEKKVQQKSSGEGSSAGVESTLKASKGKGSAMDDNTRNTMESGFGSDFSGVRIHTDSNAVNMNKSLGSKAFTNGSDIYFNEGQYSPTSKSGQHLLAHELTHTVQQGAAPKGLQQKADNEEDAPIQKMELEEETVQESTDQTIQKDDDPCAEGGDEGGSESEAESNESAPNDPSCTPSDPPVEQPAEGQEEPDGEDSARDIESQEGSPVDERQGHAPPADENAPDSEQNISEGAEEGAEAALDPCELREQQAAGGRTSGGAGSGTTAGGESRGAIANAAENAGGGSLTSAASAVGAAAGAGAATANDGAENANAEGGASANAEGTAEGEQEGDGQFLAQAIASQATMMATPGGLGEDASPELRAERDKEQSTVAEEQNRATQTQLKASELAASGAKFKLSPKKDKAPEAITQNQTISGMASSFLSEGSEQINAILANGMSMASDIKSSNATKKKTLQKRIKAKRNSLQAFYGKAREEAKAKAATTKLGIEMQHMTTMMQIEMSAFLATTEVDQWHETKRQELQTTFFDQIRALNQAYIDGSNKLRATGQRMGNAAKAYGDTKASDYRADADYEYEGFWDGYITYNRQMARVDAAKEVGTQYKDGMISQADSQIEQMQCGKSADLEMLGKFLTKGNETLSCAHLNALDAIARQKEAATMQATFAKQELDKNADDSLNATLAQYDEKEAIQMQLLNDYGIRQAMAIEKDGDKAVASAMSGINDAVDQLYTYLSQYKTTVENSETPDLASFTITKEQISAQYGIAVQSTQEAIQSSVNSAQDSLKQGFNSALQALNTIHQQGMDEGRMLKNSFNTTMDGLSNGAITTYQQLLTTSTQAIDGEKENGKSQLTAIVTGISNLMTTTVGGVGTKFDEADTGMETAMQSTIDNDMEVKICNQAEQAAADVQPWWKTALKVLLVIVVIVVVAFVIGPAVIGAVGAAASALAGSLGAGAALAGTIGAWVGPIIGGAIVGALSGAVIQVGNNLIDIAGTDKELSWENVGKGVWGAVIAGAIGGALGGLGGQFAQVLMGRLGGALGPGWQAVSKFGIESAFDVVGGVLGDLAAGNPVTWESIVMGLAIGGAVQISMGGLSAIAKNGVSAPRPGVDAPRVDADGAASTSLTQRIQNGARRLEDFQGRMMESGQNFGNRAGFGSKAPDAATTRQGIVDANARMEEGEFFPTRPAESSAPRTDIDTDINTPRTEGDAETTTPRQDGDAETTAPRQDGEAGGNRRVTDPDAAPENHQITQNDIRAEQDWIDANPGQRRRSSLEGYTDEVELPNGHIWRKNKSGGWCRFSNEPMLSRIPHELFTINLDIMNLQDRYIVPGNEIHQNLIAAEQQLRSQFQESGSRATRNRNTLSTSVGFVIQDASGEFRFVVFDPQKQFQSGLGIKTSTRTRIVSEIDPNVLGADSTTELPDRITQDLASDDPKVVKAAEREARRTASSRARAKDSPLTMENSRMGITSNTTGSLDFHSERAFYEWLRQNPNQFANAINNLGIDDPVVKAVIVDMASTRYVCPRCAMAGTNLASSGSELDFMTKMRAALSNNLIGIDPDMSVKIRASAEMLFPVGKVMPALNEFQDVLRMNTGVAGADFPMGTADYDLLRVAFAANGGTDAELKASLDHLRSAKPDLYNQLQLDQVRTQLDLTPNVEGLRILTPQFCGL